MPQRLNKWTIPQWFCLLAGALLLVRGTSVLLTGAGFGLPGEGWHAIFHLASGVVLVAACARPAASYWTTLGFALAYGIVAVAGAVDGSDALGLIPIDTRDNLIHAAYVAIALTAVAVGAHSATRAASPS